MKIIGITFIFILVLASMSVKLERGRKDRATLINERLKLLKGIDEMVQDMVTYMPIEYYTDNQILINDFYISSSKEHKIMEHYFWKEE